MATDRHDIHVHIYDGEDDPDGSSLERKIDQLMAQVDDLQQKINDLDAAVRTLLSRLPAVIDALQAEINTLIADDAIENDKLTGMSEAVDDLRGTVETFGQEASMEDPPPTDTAVEPVDPEAPPSV